MTSVPVGQKIAVSVDVTNTQTQSDQGVDQTVTWSIQEGSAGGSIEPSTQYTNDKNGGPLWVYTAPSTPGTYHLVATPNVDPGHPGSREITVQEPLTGCSVTDDKIGVWENITPPQADLTTGDWFGMQAMVIDPQVPSTLYVGRAMDGIYKSLDCGATWFKVSTGRNADVMATGRSWSMVIDPSNPQVLYAPQGYGQNGVFKTTNGGVDWDQILPPSILMFAPYGGFIGGIALDRDQPSHVLVSWHAECPPPYTKACYAETFDAGATWTMRNGEPSWAGGEGIRFDILNSTTWLFNSESNGLWLSIDAGTSWSKVPGVDASHAGGQIYRAVDGKLYMGAVWGVIQSSDNGHTWSVLPNSGVNVFGVVGDGERLYTSSFFPHYAPGGELRLQYSSTSETSPDKWTRLDTPLMKNGGPMVFDPIHNIIYSSNLDAGVWRMVVR